MFCANSLHIVPSVMALMALVNCEGSVDLGCNSWITISVQHFSSYLCFIVTIIE